jgi:hypothetical protein
VSHGPRPRRLAWFEWLSSRELERSLTDLIAAEGPDFDAAAERVLEKNEELYRRLA